MFSNKIFPTTRALIPKVARSYHVAYTQPTDKCSTGEKLIQGIFLSTCMWGYPLWVLYHLPDYQKEDRNSYTGK